MPESLRVVDGPEGGRTLSLRGVRFEVVDSGPYRSFWDAVEVGEWESETLAIVERTLSKGGRFIDIGGWIGPLTAFAGALGATVPVYEPDPRAREELTQNIDLNPFRAKVTIEPVALGIEPGRAILLSTSLGNSGSTLVRQDIAGVESVEIIVRDIAVEASEKDFASADLIKIDIEGLEYDVVPRLMSVLRSTGTAGDMLISIHTRPTFERLLRRIPRRLRPSMRVERWWRRLVRHVSVPFGIMPKAIRLAWSVRLYGDRRWSPRNGGSWVPFTTFDLVRWLVAPRDGELWLSTGSPDRGDGPLKGGGATE